MKNINKAVGCHIAVKNAYRKFCSTRVYANSLRVCEYTYTYVDVTVCVYCEFSDLYHLSSLFLQMQRFCTDFSVSHCSPLFCCFALCTSTVLCNRINLTWILIYLHFSRVSFHWYFSLWYVIWNICIRMQEREHKHNLSFICCALSLLL